MGKIFIVGNKFEQFCEHDGVFTMTEFADMAHSGLFDQIPVGSVLEAGQGVRDADLHEVCDMARPGLSVRGIDAGNMLKRKPRAGTLHTHKHKLRNCIVSTPERLNERIFEADLMVDDRSELMSDHQTGQHVQGMIIIEASRQMFLAVTEEYFIKKNTDPYYFVINSMDIVFMGFLFPLAASLRYEVISLDISNQARLAFDVLVTVTQGGVNTSQMKCSFVAFHSGRILAAEHRQAQALLKRERSVVLVSGIDPCTSNTTRNLASSVTP